MGEYIRKSVLERLLARSEAVPSPYWPELGNCLVWTGHCTAKGYGQITLRIAGQSKRCYVHRIAWELRSGPITEGQSILHLCDNPACFLFEHLKLGTHQENMDDMRRKARKLKLHAVPDDMVEHCVNGHLYRVDNNFHLTNTGIIMCRTCGRESQRRMRERQRALLN